MKPKNVMLLGFVNRAVEYLDKHMDEEPNARLAELKNIDLASIRDELSDNLDASLGTMQSTMTTLLKAGNEAFDSFIDSNDPNRINDQFSRMFDVDLDNSRKKAQDDLARLLSFYNLDNDYVKKENNDFDSVEDEYLKVIKENASSEEEVDDVESSISYDPYEDEELDSVFNEIVNNENNDNQEDEELEEDFEEIEDEEDVEEDIKEVEEKKTSKVEEDETEEEDEGDNSEEYLSSLFTDLKKQIEVENSKKEEQTRIDTQVYNDLVNKYSYIPASIVRTIYELKGQLELEYPAGIDVIVLHRVSFKDIDNLRKFVEIGLSHDYSINADEKKMIVDIFKEFENEEGRILKNILEIANQCYVLEGAYEGYNVIIND